MMAVLAGASGQAAPIGAVAAANQAVIGTPPTAIQRQLQLGVEVVAEERIQTAEIGAGQFIFLDQTTLSVWPNSDIVLDRYVYDPDRGVGDMSVTMTRGVLRFIGGRISKTTDARIRTPQGLVSVRGGIAQVIVGDGFTRVVHVAGEYSRLGDVTLSRPNALAEARTTPSGAVETRFVGVLGADEMAGLYGDPMGRGAGGLDAPPEDGAVADGLAAAGALARGSNDPDAARRAPMSTLGEQPRDPFAPGLPDSPGLTDRQIAAADRAVVDPVDPGDVIEPGGGGGGIDGGGSGGGGSGGGGSGGGGSGGGGSGGGGGGEPPVTLAFSGVEFSLLDGRDLHPRVTNGAARNLAVADGTAAALSGFRRVEDPLSPGSFTVEADGGEFPIFFLDEATDFTDALASFDRPSAVTVFVDPGVFYLAARRPIDGGPEQRVLSFFGAPTPASVWAQESGDAPLLRRYALSDELFEGAELAVPSSLGIAGADEGTGLLLIGAPNGPLLTTASAGSKWLSAQLDIQGTGATQRSSLGALTATARLNDGGAPALAGEFSPLRTGSLGEYQTFLRQPGDGIARSGVAYGLIDTQDGETAFGAGGEHLVLGQSTRLAVGDPAVKPREIGVGRFIDGFDATDPGTPYGDTRRASLEEVGVVAAARTPLAQPIGQTEFGDANAAVTHVLTGGYATAAAETSLPGSPAYLLATTSVNDVRIGFAPARNGVFVEFANLNPQSPNSQLPTQLSALSEFSVNFGGTGGRGVMLDDSRFAAQADDAFQGSLTGQIVDAADREFTPPIASDPPLGGTGGGTFQTAMTGVLASAGLVGDGAGPAAQPEFLRWGWWSASVASDPVNTLVAEDRIHLGAWVSGVTSNIADVLAATGSASYSGFAVANVIADITTGGVTQRASYVEQGAFAMTYDFADREGAISISGILPEVGGPFTGGVSGLTAPGGDHYAGGLSTPGNLSAPGGSGSVTGAFFTGAGSPIAATAGRFVLSGASENGTFQGAAAGVFGGDKN